MAHVIATHEGEFTCPWFGIKFEEHPHATAEGVVLCGQAEVTDEAALARYASDERFIVQGWEPAAKAPEGEPAGGKPDFPTQVAEAEAKAAAKKARK